MQRPFFEDLNCILKAGWLQKQSRFMKKWRKRWFSLTSTTLYTFKNQNHCSLPTEVLPIINMVALVEDNSQEFAFKIETEDCVFLIGAESLEERDHWMAAIGKLMTMIKMKNNNEQE